MSLLLWLVGGLLAGVVGEQAVHLFHERARPAARTGPAPDGHGRPPTAPPHPGERRPGRGRRGRRRTVLLCVGAAAVLLLGSVAGLALWADILFGRIERVPVADALRRGGKGTNYLLVGTDSRAGVSGNRSDTILLLRVEGGRGRMLSIPRDLYVKIASTGRRARINSAYAGGPANLIRTIDAELGLPVDRYLEVDFAGFGPLVDAIGGVDIDFPRPAFDTASGLDVKQSGRVRLDGDQALAYVRSRHYTEIVDGRERTDPTSDFGRQQRQQTFLRTVLAKAGGTRDPFRLMKVASALSKGVRIDDAMSFWDAVTLGRRVGSLDPGTEALPVRPLTLSTRAQVLTLDQPAAEAVLAQFRP